MNTPLCYFVLGSLFTLGTLHPIQSNLLKVISVTSLLVYIYTSTISKGNEGKIRIFKHTDIVIFVISLVIESAAQNIVPNAIKFKIITNIGSAIIIISTVFFYYTLKYLSFKRSNEKGFVRTGPYKIMRHPIYFSIVLYWIGCCIFLYSFVSLTIFCWFISNKMPKRVREEEKHMIGVSTDYLEYRRKVWSGVPFFS